MSGAVRRVLIIGGGWSGLACALRLADAGVLVTVNEAAPQLGGRARRVELELAGTRHTLDNGQHLLVGAYARILALLTRVGVDAGSALLRVPFQLHYRDGFSLQAARLPAPWHLGAALLAARGMSLSERASLAAWVLEWRGRGWRVLEGDCAASELFARVPRRLVERLWEPLCLAALNVRLAEASGQLLLNVLRDTLASAAPAADFLVPRFDLSRLFPDAAARALERTGATLRCGARAVALARTASDWRVSAADDWFSADAVVLALPPGHAAALLPHDRELAPIAAQLRAIRYAPIATIYLDYGSNLRLPHVIQPLCERPEQSDFGQWVFDRAALDSAQAGLASVVISGAGPHLDLDHETLARVVALQLARELGLPQPRAHAVIVEKRATIVPAPGLVRPPARIAAGLYLAGDAADNPYPSTLEGSVRAGQAAADACLQDLARAALRP